MAFTCISVYPRDYHLQVMSEIMRMDSIKEIYGITDEHDLLLKLQVKLMKEFSGVFGRINSLADVAKTHIMVVVDLIKP